MRYFTPALLIDANSSDEAVIGAADAGWETALDQYRAYLDAIADGWPEQVKALTRLCLHDAELLVLNQAAEPVWWTGAERGPALPQWSRLAVVSVKLDVEVTSLIYGLWDDVRESPAVDAKPFGPDGVHWLYDEVDAAKGTAGRFLHRILWSDGRVTEVPFAFVMTHRYGLRPPSTAAAPLRSA